MMNLDEDKRKKREKDQLVITVIGLIVYSIVLIFIMAGSYIGVKTLIRHNEEKLAQMALEEEAIKEEEPEETPEEDTADIPEEEEEKLDEHIVDLSEICDSQTRYIDYGKELFAPSKRDTSLGWQDTVFSRIENTQHPQEAEVNNYTLKRVYGYLLDGTEIEYEVFTNPETDLIEKIRSVSYLGDLVEVISYYYNLGNINYISQYTKTVDTPIDVSTAAVENRYYFNSDEMVKYIYCENDTATEYKVGDIGTYSSGTVEQYDYLEKKMINSAYITYNVAKGLTDIKRVSGYVLDEFNQPMEGAHIRAVRTSDGEVMAETDADGDGKYGFELEASNDSMFKVEITKGGLIPVDVYKISALVGAGDFYVEPVYMSYEGNTTEYNLQLLVRDATDMSKALPMASLKLRNGINNTDGEVIYEGTLNEAGAAIVLIRAGNYTAQVSLGGYEDAYFTVIVKNDHQAVLGYAVPDLPEDTFATILSWDTTPLDLDARVIYANGKQVLRSANDSIGATTPEVVYIENTTSEDYSYYVSDYTAAVVNDPLSYNMSSSNAVITIYNSEGMVTSLHVPTAHSGYVWNAFKIRNRLIMPVNRYYYVLETDSYWTTK